MIVFEKKSFKYYYFSNKAFFNFVHFLQTFKREILKIIIALYYVKVYLKIFLHRNPHDFTFIHVQYRFFSHSYYFGLVSQNKSINVYPHPRIFQKVDAGWLAADIATLGKLCWLGLGKMRQLEFHCSSGVLNTFCCPFSFLKLKSLGFWLV